MSFTRSAFVLLDRDFRLIASDAFAIPQGPRRLQRAAALFSKMLRLGVRPDVASAFPELVVIEDNAYGCQSRVTLLKLAQLNTILKLVCEIADIDWLELSPSAIKKEITGKGNSEKHVVARELKRLCGVEFKSDPGFDLSDAASCAYWGVRHLTKGKGAA